MVRHRKGLSLLVWYPGGRWAIGGNGRALQWVMEQTWRQRAPEWDVLYAPGKCPQRGFPVLTGAKLVTGNHLYFIPRLTFGSFPSADVCGSLSLFSQLLCLLSHSPPLFLFYSFSFSLSFQLSHPFIVLTLIRLHHALPNGGKSMSCGRADGAAPFKYLMELTGSADLLELRGELKVRFPKATTSTAQLRSTPWSRWLTSENNVRRIQVLCECR